MLARIRKAQENEDGGFTLIELLVVMIIIGILAAIAIPAFLSQKKKGFEASEKSDLRSIATEVSTALVDYPTTGGTVVDAAGKATVSIATTPAATTSSINLSPGNSVVVGKIATDGSYCVALKNGSAGQDWKITGGAATTQSIAKTAAAVAVAGDCP